MKNIFAVLALVFSALIVNGQVEPRDQFTCGFYHVQLLNTSESYVATPEKSLGFNAHFYKEYPLGKGIFSLAWGTGYSFLNLHSNLSLADNREQFQLNNAAVGNRSLTQHFIEIPLALRIRSKKRDKFILTTGVRGGFLLGHSEKTEEGNITTILKYRDPVNQFRYGPYARIGWGAFAFESFYSINSFLNYENGQFVPFTIGITYLYGKRFGL